MKAVFCHWFNKLPTKTNLTEPWEGYTSFNSFLCSWVKSILYAKKYFSSIELYCDEPTRSLFVDYLDLPVDKIYTIYQPSNNNNLIYNKVLCLSQQTEEFTYIDGDVHLYNPILFTEKVQAGFWVKEKINYSNGLNCLYSHGYEFVSSFNNKIKLLEDNPLDALNNMYAVNVGITYIKNPNELYFKEYLSTLVDFFNFNSDAKHIKYNICSWVLEQYFLWLLLEKHQILYDQLQTTDDNYPDPNTAMPICKHYLSSYYKTYFDKEIQDIKDVDTYYQEQINKFL